MALNVRALVCTLATFGTAMSSPWEAYKRATESSPSNNSTITSAAAAASSTLILSNSTSSSMSLNSTFPANASTTATILEDSTPSSAAAITATASADLAAISNEVKACHRTESENPFCKPKDLQQLTAGDTYPFIWDTKVFDPKSTNSIELKYLNTTIDDDVFKSFDEIPNEKGYALIEMKAEWLNKTNTTDIAIFLVSEGNNRTIRSGPTLNLIRNSSTPFPEPSTKKPSKVGVEAGIPIGLALVIGVLLLLCCGRKNQRKSALATIMGRRRGNPTGQPRAQRVGDGNQLREGDIGAGRGGFRDEPERGVELQDRTRQPHSREGSFGSWGNSPTQEQFGSRGQGGGNVFRDEISRQRRDHDAWR